MNYTDLNEDQKYDVREAILEDCDELRWDEIGVRALAKKYAAKDIQELIREANLYPFVSIPEDLVIDNWDKFMIDHWTDFPNGYWYAMVGCL